MDSVSSSDMVQYKTEREEEPPSYKPTIILSTIYNGLKSFKDKLVKIIRSVPTPQLSLKTTKNKCVTSNRQRQVRSSRKEEKRKFFEFDQVDENDVSKCIDINEIPDDSMDTLLTSDISTQADVTACSCQEDDTKFTYSSCREVTDNMQAGLLSLINSNRLFIDLNRVTDELSRDHVKQTFCRNKLRKYKICSCGSHCPYALYKSPCCDRNGAPGKKTDDEVGELTLECSSFGEKNNFPKFVNIDAGRKDCNGGLADFGTNESSMSSLSVDLEVDVCGDYDRPKENVDDECSKRTRTRTHVMRVTNAKENHNTVNHSRNENKPLMNVNLEENQQEHRTRMADFTHAYQLIRSNNKLVQCSSAILRDIRRASMRTSTPDFRRSGSNFSKVIAPRPTKVNTHTQTRKRLHFNRLRGIDFSIDLGVKNKQSISEAEDKKILREKNTCEICDSLRQQASSRTGRCNAQFALRTERDGETYSNKSTNQTDYFKYRRDKVAPLRTSCPYHCDCVLAKKREHLATLMSRLAEYHLPHRILDFDMSNVSRDFTTASRKSRISPREDITVFKDSNVSRDFSSFGSVDRNQL